MSERHFGAKRLWQRTADSNHRARRFLRPQGTNCTQHCDTHTQVESAALIKTDATWQMIGEGEC